MWSQRCGKISLSSSSSRRSVSGSSLSASGVLAGTGACSEKAPSGDSGVLRPARLEAVSFSHALGWSGGIARIARIALTTGSGETSRTAQRRVGVSSPSSSAARCAEAPTTVPG